MYHKALGYWFFCFFALVCVAYASALDVPPGVALCVALSITFVLYDIRVKRSKSRSCLHNKTFELGTRQTRENSDLCSKSVDFECLRIAEAALQRSNWWISS